MDSLFMRRENLCRKFTQKSLKNPKFKQWFKPNLANLLTRKVQTYLMVLTSSQQIKK